MATTQTLVDSYYGNDMRVPLPASVATTTYVGRERWEIEKRYKACQADKSGLFTELVDLGAGEQALMSAVSRGDQAWSARLHAPRDGEAFELCYTVPEVYGGDRGYGYFSTVGDAMKKGTCYFYLVARK